MGAGQLSPFGPAVPGRVGAACHPIVEDLDHPEGLAVSEDGMMLFAGGENGQVYRVDPLRGVSEQIGDLGGFVLGLAVDGDGFVYACVEDRVARLDPRDGMVTVYSHIGEDGPYTLPNFCAFDANGHLIVSDSGSQSVRGRQGAIYRISPGGGTGHMMTPRTLNFPNGLAMRWGQLLIAESTTGNVLQLSTSGHLDVLHSSSAGVLDGLAVEDDGCVLLSYFQPNLVERLSPGGQVQTVVCDPSGWELFTPTNVCFYGPHREHLAAASLGGWGLTGIEVTTRGSKLHYPSFKESTR